MPICPIMSAICGGGVLMRMRRCPASGLGHRTGLPRSSRVPRREGDSGHGGHGAGAGTASGRVSTGAMRMLTAILSPIMTAEPRRQLMRARAVVVPLNLSHVLFHAISRSYSFPSTLLDVALHPEERHLRLGVTCLLNAKCHWSVRHAPAPRPPPGHPLPACALRGVGRGAAR